MCLFSLTCCRERSRSAAQLSFYTTNSMQHLIVRKCKQCSEVAVKSAGSGCLESLLPPKGGLCLRSRVMVTAGPCSPWRDGAVCVGDSHVRKSNASAFVGKEKEIMCLKERSLVCFIFSTLWYGWLNFQEQHFLSLIFPGRGGSIHTIHSYCKQTCWHSRTFQPQYCM